MTSPQSEETALAGEDMPEIKLEDLPESLRRAVERAGWEKLQPVQSRSIPYLLKGLDLMVQSRTGSGKTGAFILPMLDRLDLKRNTTQALVLAPTRELARQVAAEAEMLFGDSGMRVAAVYGGVGYGAQRDAFRRGAHLVAGTPGRVLDHLIQGSLKLDDLRVMVFDEADRMLSMGFYPDMKKVQRFLPRRRINASMFSATWPPHVMGLAREFLHEPEFLSLSHDQVHVAEIDHLYYETPPMEKDRALARIIEIENPVSAIIFCNTKVNVHYVATVLSRFGYDADQLSADLSQSERERVLQRVREKSLRFLVATDVAARGIDIPNLSHIIQYDLPEDRELFIHRSGRTGRAGAGGISVTLVSGLETLEIKRLAAQYEIDMENRTLPTEEDVQAVVSERVTALLEARRRDRDKLKVERMQRFMPLARELAKEEDSLALLAMLIDDYYQESLHAPPEQPEGPETKKPTRKPAPAATESEPGRRRSRGGRGRKKRS